MYPLIKISSRRSGVPGQDVDSFKKAVHLGHHLNFQTETENLVGVPKDASRGSEGSKQVPRVHRGISKSSWFGGIARHH